MQYACPNCGRTGGRHYRGCPRQRPQIPAHLRLNVFEVATLFIFLILLGGVLVTSFMAFPEIHSRLSAYDTGLYWGTVFIVTVAACMPVSVVLRIVSRRCDFLSAQADPKRSRQNLIIVIATLGLLFAGMQVFIKPGDLERSRANWIEVMSNPHR
jgi:hypothetical protein